MLSSKYTPKTAKTMKRTLSSGSETSDKLRDPVSVFCRLRPLKEDRESSCVKLISPSTLCLSTPTDSKILRPDVHYTFKHIFTSYSSQKEVFDHVALPLLGDLLNGKNGLLFTYGVTGSGKTYTLTGEQNNPGIMPRCIYTIFNSVDEYQSEKFMIKSDRLNGFEVQTERDAAEERLQEQKLSQRSLKKRVNSAKGIYDNDGTKILGISHNCLYAVFVSYTEIYNNCVYDLLDETSNKTLQSKIVREDCNKNMYVHAVVEMEVKTAGEAFELFNLGQKRKRMAHTCLNSESSRSHSIFNIRVVQLEKSGQNLHGDALIPDRNFIKLGQLSLVDLAGSERTSRTQNTGSRLKEASNINNSLMSLRSCMDILRDNQMTGGSRLVPYRDSKLTLLFKNYFEGEGRVEMIVCANPSVQDFDENLHVMKFAEVTQEVKVVRPESRYTPYKKPTHKHYKSTPAGDTPLKLSAPLVFGPRIPDVKFDLGNFEEVSSALLKALYTRREKALQFDRELSDKNKRFRKRLVDLCQDNVLKITEVRSVKQLMKKERQKCSNLETKVLDLESSVDSALAKNEELKEVIRSLNSRIDEKDLKLNQTYLDREKSKKRMVKETEKMTQELDEKLRKQRQHLNAGMQARDKKLQQVRDILSHDEVVDSDENMPLHSTEDSHQQKQLLEQQKLQLEQKQLLEQQQKVPFSSNSSAIRTPRPVIQSQKRSRRSRSAGAGGGGDLWLEHNAVRPVPLGTVMQPQMKRRKSVTRLTKASDVVHGKQSKYCLISQEPDTDGELETKLYKGDIVQTCGGGAQVVFSGVERLREESPTGGRK